MSISDEATGRVQWRDGVCCALLVCLPLLFSFGFYSFEHPKELLLLAALIPLAWTAQAGAFGASVRALLPLWLWLGVAVPVGLATAAVPAYVVEEAGRVLVLLLFTGVVWDWLSRPGAPSQLALALGTGSVAVAVVGLAQYAGLAHAVLPAVAGYDQPVYSVFGNQDLFGGYLALGSTLLLADWTRSRSARWHALQTGALLLLSAGLVLSGSRSAWLAAAAGAALVLAQRGSRRARWGRLVAVVLLGVLPAVVIAWPRPLERITATFSAGDVGGPARLWFWDGTMRMIQDAPVLGLGLGQFPYHSPGYLGAALAAPGGNRHYHNELHTEHAHNVLLELLAETGVVGLCFALWLLGRILWRGSRTSWPALAALGVFALFNAAAHSLPFALAGLLLLAQPLASRVPLAAPSTARPRHRLALAALCLAVVLLRLWTVQVPSVLLTRAEDAHLRGEPCEPRYHRALAWPWPNAEAHEGLAIASIEAGRPARARVELTHALRGLDTGRVHLLLGEVALACGDTRSAVAALETCLHRWPSNLRAWRTLWELSPPLCPALEAHARHWGLPQPQD
jgi:O-antigen ligase